MSKMFVADSGWSTLIDAASEAELISRSRQGDHTAFVSALQLHDPHLRRLTSNAIGDPQEVDRLLLAVYIEARSTLLAGEAEGPFGTWLIRLVFEACDDAKSSSKSSMATHSSSNLSQTRSPGHASLVEMTLEETFAITLVAGERLALTHVVSLLDTNVNGLTVMLRNARQALTSKGSEAADQIVADLAGAASRCRVLERVEPCPRRPRSKTRSTNGLLKESRRLKRPGYPSKRSRPSGSPTTHPESRSLPPEPYYFY